MKKIILSIIFSVTLSTLTYAHDGEKHEKQNPATEQTVLSSHVQAEQDHQEATPSSSVAGSDGNITASWDEFPNLHPLIVHFPIVLLILAAIAQIVQFFAFNKALSWVILVLLVSGFAGALVAGTLVHPHPQGLSEFTKKVLDEHELYASLSLWLSGVAVVLKVVSHFWLKRKIWSEILVCIVLLSSAYMVSMAGHHGSQLVFIEGVGPQGKFLETDH